MPDRTISAASVEYVEVAVGASADPTAGAVDIGFSTAEDTAPSTWHAASWTGQRRVVSDGSGYGSGYVARRLVGSGATDLAVGTYYVWVRVVAGAETIVRDTGNTLTVV